MKLLSSFWLTSLVVLGPISETLVHAFVCNDGCVLENSFVDDEFCDCAECEDESELNCDTCFQGCPTQCGRFMDCTEGNEYFGLSFECTGILECDYDIFYCVDPGTGDDNPICNITCSGTQSCSNSLVVVANTGGVQLNCAGENSCAYMQVTWVNSDNLDTYKAVDANAAVGGPLHKIDCGQTTADTFACWDFHIAGDTQQLGLDTVTQWNCAQEYSCAYASAAIRGSIFVDCAGINSCVVFDLRCMSGANCETMAINSDAADGASMTCDSGVQSCVCSEFFDCLQLTAEPMTSTAEASTTTTDPSTTTVDPSTSTTLAETTTTEALATSTTPTDPSTTVVDASSTTPDASSTTPTKSTMDFIAETTETTKSQDSSNDSFDWMAVVAMVAMAVVALIVCVLTTGICVYCFWLKNANLQEAVKELEVEYSLDADGSIHLLDEETPEPLDTTSIFLKSTDDNAESGEPKIKAAPRKKDSLHDILRVDFENPNGTADGPSVVAETSKAQGGEGIDAVSDEELIRQQPEGGKASQSGATDGIHMDTAALSLSDEDFEIELMFSKMPATDGQIVAGSLGRGWLQADDAKQSGAMDAAAGDRMYDSFVARMGHIPADASALAAFSRTVGASLSDALAKQIIGYRALAANGTETKGRVAADGLSEIVSRLKLSAHSAAQKRNARLLQAAVERHRATMQLEFEELSALQLASDRLLELLLDKADTLAQADACRLPDDADVAEGSEATKTPSPRRSWE